MQRSSAVATALALVTALSVTATVAAAQAPADLVGGWIVSSWTFPDGKVSATPQPGLFLFTATGQYSMMYATGDAARPRYEGDDQTDAEVIAAYRSFVANSGRYSVTGKVISYEAFVAKDPNYMGNWNAQTRANAQTLTYSVTNGILTLQWMRPDGTLSGQLATLRRPTG